MELYRYTRILNVFSIYFESITIQPKVGVYSILTTLNLSWEKANCVLPIWHLPRWHKIVLHGLILTCLLILTFSVHFLFYPTLSYNEHYFYPTLSYLIVSIPKLLLKNLSWETANCVLPIWHLPKWHEIVLHGLILTCLSPSFSLLRKGLVSLIPAQLLQGPSPFWLFSLQLHLLLPHTS